MSDPRSLRMLALTLLVPMVASGLPGCASEEPFDEECIPSAWHDEAEANPEFGVPVSLSLEGSHVRMRGTRPSVEVIAAPLTIEPGQGANTVAFQDPIVDGVEVRALVLHGRAIAASGGRFTLGVAATTAVDDRAAWVTPPGAEDDDARLDVGSVPTGDEDELDRARPFDIVAEELRVTAYDEGYIVTDGEARPVTGPITVSATRAYWSYGTNIGANSITARWEGDVAVGIEPRTGSMRTEDGPIEALPQVILGRDGYLEVGPGHVRTVEDMFVRQALDEDGPLLPSAVELRLCASPTLVMSRGESRTLRFAYRQPGNLTDAAFTEAWFHDGRGSVQAAKLNIDDTLPAALTSFTDANAEASWGSAVGEFLGALAEASGGILVDIITCIFSIGLACGGDDDNDVSSLDSYPVWMESNRMGEFEVTVTAPTRCGTYDARLEIAGYNYETSVPMEIVVRR